MRILLVIFLFFLLTICASAQTVSKIKLQNPGSGKITLVEGKKRATIDLSKNIFGCPYVSSSQKRILDQKGCTAAPATIKLVDAVVKDKLTFLVLQSVAAGNCNVCGKCGSNETFTLIWLKLDTRLRVLDKKSVLVDDCAEKIYSLTPELSFDEKTQTARLLWENNVSIWEFEKLITENDAVFYQFTHLEYRRKTPEKGFVIKTEKRARTSAQQQ
jgi:hypothetical protein